jgi:protein-tyrosine phosphatase
VSDSLTALDEAPETADGGLVDIHSHLVPGVDDGARQVSDVLESVERMRGEGIGRILTTAAAGAIAEAYPEIEYLRGHEVLIDLPEPDLSDPRMRLAGTSFVLIEWPRLAIPPGTGRVIRWIRDQGYRPVVAHPERYSNILRQPDMVRSWRDAGAFLQVNYGSLVGRYGSEARDMAFRLLETELVDYLASDFHGKSSLKIYCAEAHEALRRRAPAGLLDTLTRVNPSRLLDGLDPLPAAPLPQASKILERLRRIVVRPDRPEKKRTT